MSPASAAWAMARSILRARTSLVKGRVMIQLSFPVGVRAAQEPVSGSVGMVWVTTAAAAARSIGRGVAAR